MLLQCCRFTRRHTRLRDFLKAGRWNEAHQETLAIMLCLAGRIHEGYLTSQSVSANNFPSKDLCTIDKLWVQYSNGHFGFSVQKRIWHEIGGHPNATDNWQLWRKFGEQVGWCQGWFGLKNISFTINAPKGHLPGVAGWAGKGWLMWGGRRGGFWLESLLSRKDF